MTMSQTVNITADVIALQNMSQAELAGGKIGGVLCSKTA